MAIATSSEVKIIGLWASSWCVRIEVALKLKGICYEYIEEDLITKSPLLLQLNPIHKKIPLDSPLMPTDPHERALLRFWANFFNTKMSGSGKTIFSTQGEEQEKEVPALKEFLNILENGLKIDFRSNKPFFNGETPGYLELVSGAKLIDQESTPFLFSWITDFCEFGMVKEALPDQAKLLAFAKKRRGILLEFSKHQ
ncbi:hypothetical protein AMTRI_Chr04g253000 [Amborella trichopoda]